MDIAPILAAIAMHGSNGKNALRKKTPTLILMTFESM